MSEMRVKIGLITIFIGVLSCIHLKNFFYEKDDIEFVQALPEFTFITPASAPFSKNNVI